MKLADINDIQKIFHRFAAAYGNKLNAPTKETISEWVKAFEECNAAIVDEAASECIKKYAFPPAISEMYQEYTKLDEQRRKENQELRDVWSVAKSMYPTSLVDDKAAKYIFCAIKQIKTHEDRLDYMQYVSRCVNRIVRESDGNLPLLSECLEEVLWGEQTG